MTLRIHSAFKASQEQKDMALSQKAFYEQLKSLFSQQFADQKQTLQFLMSKIQPILDSPSGFFPGEEAAMRTQASDTVSGQYNTAAQNWQTRAFQLGGREMPGGALLQGLAGMDAARAGAESTAQNQITMQGALQRLQNFWNAASTLGGVARMQDPSALMSGAISQGSSAQKAIDEAFKPSGLWQKILAGVVTGVAGTLLPGVGGLLGGALFGTAGAGSALGTGGGDFFPSAPEWGTLAPSIYGSGPTVGV